MRRGFPQLQDKKTSWLRTLALLCIQKLVFRVNVVTVDHAVEPSSPRSPSSVAEALCLRRLARSMSVEAFVFPSSFLKHKQRAYRLQAPDKHIAFCTPAAGKSMSRGNRDSEPSFPK